MTSRNANPNDPPHNIALLHCIRFLFVRIRSINSTLAKSKHRRDGSFCALLKKNMENGSQSASVFLFGF